MKIKIIPIVPNQDETLSRILQFALISSLHNLLKKEKEKKKKKKKLA